MSGAALLLVNTGSPSAPTPAAVRTYLRSFLMDPRILAMPKAARWTLVNLVIAPTRAGHVAKAYGSVWTPEGAPLVAITRRTKEAVEREAGAVVEMGMVHGEPSIASALERIRERHAGLILCVPLFPHFAEASFGSGAAAVRAAAKEAGMADRVSIVAPYFENSGYIEALLEVCRAAISRNVDHILFSYHGLPLAHLRAADPTGGHCLASAHCCDDAPADVVGRCYRAQVRRTTEALSLRAGWDPRRYSISFQSRLGPGQWLGPNTTEVLREWPRRGARRLAVVCPSFVTDCLETLEEIGMRGREIFLGAGGEEFTLVPCLNDAPAWIRTLEKWRREARDA